jgi:hypothetical protein
MHNTSTHQCINASMHQRINASTQHINTAHQHNTSKQHIKTTHQNNNTSTHQHKTSKHQNINNTSTQININTSHHHQEAVGIICIFNSCNLIFTHYIHKLFTSNSARNLHPTFSKKFSV